MNFSELVHSHSKVYNKQPEFSLGVYLHKLDREPSLDVFYMFVLSAIGYFKRPLNNSELSYLLETVIQKNLWDVLNSINVPRG